ncbi:hypothetical protein AB0D49_03200 [Streptomyces sp. NPDC048290]|uniref:hypothetical protein n=1 Tax=Streptomyces sp. NPDC048290 TaxID=3155811 RepID=UPI0034143AB0
MFGSKKNEPPLVFVRDAGQVTGALRRALDATDADAGERAGLERALAIAEEVGALPEEELQKRWVRERLDSAGYQGKGDTVEAVKALRQSVPGLSLLTATQLARSID